MSEGDEVLETDLKDLSASPEGRPWFPRLMSERMVWNLVPWLLIGAWVGLYFVKG
jgi:hypothetical protein